MKIAYILPGIYNSGGVEKTVILKANYLADIMGYDVTIITCDNNGSDSFFEISKNVKIQNIDIEFKKYLGSYFWLIKRIPLIKKYKKQLKKILFTERFDIVISVMWHEFPFLYKFKDGSKKVLEFHFTKYCKVILANNLIKKIIQFLRISVLWGRKIKKYDKFVLLTEKDRKDWNNLNNSIVIPNFVSISPIMQEYKETKNVLSVGRINFEKGFDLLIKAWSKVHSRYNDWKLTIVGDGDKTELSDLVNSLGLEAAVSLLPATKNINEFYRQSSLYVLSSRYEGFGIVMIEAMANGLPVVAFDCPYGPREIIDTSFGSLVEAENIDELSDVIIKWIDDKKGRIDASMKAREHAMKFSQENIMDVWDNLFKSLMSNI